MPGTVTLIMRDPKRAGNLPSDFFTREREAGAKFPSKKVSLAGPGDGQPLHSEKVTLAVSRSRILSASPSHLKNVSINNFLSRIVSAV